MRMVSDPADVPADVATDPPVCLVVRPADLERAGTDLHRLGLGGGPGLDRAHLHPFVWVEHDRVRMLVYAAMSGTGPAAVELSATRGALVVVADQEAGDAVTAAVRELDVDDARRALAPAVAALARLASTSLADLADQVSGLEESRMGYAQGARRGDMRRLRARLFAGQEVFAAQTELLAPDGDLADAVPGGDPTALRRARAGFDVSRGTASRLYALVGDLMSEQSAVVNERLTLVSTVFLPLTVTTGFFGMNFGWLVDRVGSATAFVVLGLLVPVLVTVATLLTVRRLGAGVSGGG